VATARGGTPGEPTLGAPAVEELPLLRGLPCFAEFGEQELGDLVRALSLWPLERGTTLFSDGDAARSAFVVVRGAIEVSRVRGDRRLRLATVGPGRLLGELSLIDGGPRTATCSAAEPALVLELRRDVAAKLLEDRSPAALGVPARGQPRADRRAPRDRGRRRVARPARPSGRQAATRREDPRLRDRRRRRPRRAVRGPPDRLRRLHGLAPRTELHRGLHPRRGAAAVREHAHRSVRDRAPDDASARGRPPGDPPRGQRVGQRRRDLLRNGRDRRDRQARAGPRRQDPERARRPPPDRRRDPRGGAPGRLRRPIRAPLERAAVARVDRRRGHDPRGRGRSRRPRPARGRAPAVRRPAAQDRQLLGRLERDRDRDGRRAGRDRAPPSRSAVLLGLRRCRPVSPDRHEPVTGAPRRPPRLQGRGLHLPAQVRRRPGDAGNPRRQALALPEPPPLSRAAGRSGSSARARTPTTPTR
jgi:CRP-like cAMP-binding protein